MRTYLAFQEIVADLYAEADRAIIEDNYEDASLLQSQADKFYQVAENLGFLIAEVDR